uniref:Uncharacterized protein n=1 Tax=Morchella importuna TaxID=1174673 RepID=A0A650AFK3_9PEZI|nr:hypothetical protein [Morchella importuna]QGN66777.1 hypothetical protein [Morchella importuna]
MGHAERYARPVKEQPWSLNLVHKILARASLSPLQWGHNMRCDQVVAPTGGRGLKRGRLLSCRHKNCWKIFTISPRLDFLLLLTWQILTLEILTEFQVLWKYLNGL